MERLSASLLFNGGFASAAELVFAGTSVYGSPFILSRPGGPPGQATIVPSLPDKYVPTIRPPANNQSYPKSALLSEALG
jgi:hypothetical protein